MMSTKETPIEAKGDNLDSKGRTRKHVNPELFENFMHSANQWELEYLLVLYLKIHADVSIFLRNRIVNRCPDCIGSH
ncbi:hypothetical protein ElyMa_006364400 [Elysia marginata]|uniref:Uncharacterized protein n=1 Tax=Elysia marginata TaxID=1093978 RepID=A0AAV4HQI9_9GAST|nr:hypothetical protein ElyMa_006364400 [Elysia marginata]